MQLLIQCIIVKNLKKNVKNKKKLQLHENMSSEYVIHRRSEYVVQRNREFRDEKMIQYNKEIEEF